MCSGSDHLVVIAGHFRAGAGLCDKLNITWRSLIKQHERAKDLLETFRTMNTRGEMFFRHLQDKTSIGAY